MRISNLFIAVLGKKYTLRRNGGYKPKPTAYEKYFGIGGIYENYSIEKRKSKPPWKRRLREGVNHKPTACVKM